VTKENIKTENRETIASIACPESIVMQQVEESHNPSRVLRVPIVLPIHQLLCYARLANMVTWKRLRVFKIV
jgi:hypothetical protein